MLARQAQHQIAVQRLGEAGIGHRRREAPGGQLVGGLHRVGQARAVGQDGDLAALAQDPATADFQGGADVRQGAAARLAARIAAGRGAVVDLHLGRHHVHQLDAVGRRHQHHIGQAAQIGDVVAALVGHAVGAHHAGTVDGKAHRQLLDGHVVDHLVIAALQEGRVDRSEGLVAVAGEPGAEGHRVLLGDADIEGAVRELGPELVQPGTAGHGRRHRDHLGVALGVRDQRLGEDVLIVGRLRRALLLLAGDDVELGDAVILVLRGLGRRVALALLRHAVNQHRAFPIAVAHVLQDRQQMLEVVAVDGADIEEAQLFEERAAGEEAARILFCPLGRLLDRPREAASQIARQLTHRLIGLGGEQARQIGAHRTDRRGDRHVVVVQDDDQPRMHGTGVVHRLVGHAGGHGAVADHADNVVVALVEVAGHRKAEPGRNRGGGVGGTEGVVDALLAAGETAEASVLAQGADALTPTGQYLVRIALMRDVPDQNVLRRLEDVVQRGGELDHAQAGAQVPAGDGDRIDQLLAQFVSQLRQLLLIQLAQLFRRGNLVQQCRSAVVPDLAYQKLVLLGPARESALPVPFKRTPRHMWEIHPGRSRGHANTSYLAASPRPLA